MESKIIYSLGLGLFAVMTFCDASGINDQERGAVPPALEQKAETTAASANRKSASVVAQQKSQTYLPLSKRMAQMKEKVMESAMKPTMLKEVRAPNPIEQLTALRESMASIPWYKWTPEERETAITKIVGQTETIQSVLQGAESLDLHQVDDLLNQVRSIWIWIDRLTYDKHSEIGDNYYVIDPVPALIRERRTVRNFLVEWKVWIDKLIQLSYRVCFIGGTKEQYHVLYGTVHNLIAALYQIRDKMPKEDEN